MNTKGRQAVSMTILCGVLCTATSGLRADEQSTASNAFSSGTKEFLSDPARTGSLVGSILAGAAVANPLAPLLGSVAGFMIGKSSAFSDNKSNTARNTLYSNRSLMPDDSSELDKLAGFTGDPSEFVESTVVQKTSEEISRQPESAQSLPTISLALPGNPAVGHRTGRSEQILFVNIAEGSEHDDTPSLSSSSQKPAAPNIAATAGISVQKKLAHACRNTQTIQPLGLMCYYQSQ